MTDYFSKYEHGWRISPTSTGADPIKAVKIGSPRPSGLAARRSLNCCLCTPAPVPRCLSKLVTDNGPAFKGAAFGRFAASRPELAHIRTRVKSPGHNGVRERAFGLLKYEHLYRHADQIATLADLYREG